MTMLVKTDQLLVTRRDPATQRYERVGILSFDADRYRFEYDADARRPLPGLPLGAPQESSVLFPIFAERVMDPRRPERLLTLGYLGLDGDAGPFEVLAVSGGGRTGDMYELTPVPQPGEVDLSFLVHGIRHLMESERAVIDELASGDRLTLRAEPGNPIDARALLVTQDGQRLGYVPGPLLDYVHAIITGAHELVVDRVNPASAGMHMRLLVRLRGRYDG